MNVCILIPAYNPDENLCNLILKLQKRNLRNIVVVNDGSMDACRPFFDKIHSLGVTVLQHKVNQGKGTALKTGFTYIETHRKEIMGVITADADGQHTSEDIVKIAEHLKNHPDSLVLGTRTFQGNIPFRSLLGNTITRIVFFLVAGIKVSDTQTGLRGIPIQFLSLFQTLKGDRYEYETNMLLATKIHNIPVREQTITTIYIEGNKNSKFNPFLDSMKIYFLLLRFVFSSLLASLIDFMVFISIYHFFHNSIFAAIVLARVIASLVNFFTNKTVVFHNKASYPVTLVKYYVLTLVMMGLAYLFISFLAKCLGFNVVLAKAVAETFLFVINFYIQKDFIFVRCEAK